MRSNYSKINTDGHVYIVAEAGINHNGDIELAKQMIKKAAECGSDAIKFQTLLPDELFSERLNPELYSLIKKWSLTKKQHIELKKFANKHKIDFFSTPVGHKSLKLLQTLNIKPIKIASGELMNIDLIKSIAKSKTPMIISTGMSTIQEIITISKIIKKEKCPFILLHCVSSYPTPINETNLSTITFLQKKIKVPVGYSDHTLGIESCLVAVSLGACVIEKHFTLDKNMEGPDQKLSANPDEFRELVSKIRIVEQMIGSPRSDVFSCEKNFRKLMRKSIGTAVDISKGTKIKKSMLTLYRPGTGLQPVQMNKLVGKKIKKTVKKGVLLKLNMF